MRIPASRTIQVVSAAVALTACQVADTGRVVESAEQRLPPPALDDAVIRSFAAENNQFAVELYQRLGSESGNLVFSPYSLSSALAMAYAGARETTEAQMAASLHYALPPEDLHRAFNQLEQMLGAAAEPSGADAQRVTLRIANGIWAEQSLPVRSEYLDVLAHHYGAGLRLADFLTASEGARLEINEWVSEQTEQRIRELIGRGALDSRTRMLLVNAIYFKGDWQEQFVAADTQPGTFHLLDGSTVEVPMMSGYITDALYYEEPNFQAVQLPYAGKTAAMTLIVPTAQDFPAFERDLAYAGLADILAALAPSSLQLGLPTFSFSSAFDIGEQLSSLGMPDAFDPDRADFSGITGGRDLYISKVLHQAFVAVDEKGTEAAAATSVIMGPTSIQLPDLTVTVDRPFLFILSDLQTQQILFFGRVVDPTR